MINSITYNQLERFLLELGFTDISVQDSHSGFRHEPSNTVVLLGLHDANELAAPRDVIKVRRVLDERGLYSAQDFDAFLAKGKPPQKTSAG